MLIQQKVADRINEKIIAEAVSKKDDNVSVLLNNFGLAWSDLGDNNKAIDFYNKALEIDLSVYGDKHPNVEIRYNNLGAAWSDLGDNKKTIEFYNKALEIFTAVYGKDHPNTKTVQGNIEAMKKGGG